MSLYYIDEFPRELYSKLKRELAVRRCRRPAFPHDSAHHCVLPSGLLDTQISLVPIFTHQVFEATREVASLRKKNSQVQDVKQVEVLLFWIRVEDKFGCVLGIPDLQHSSGCEVDERADEGIRSLRDPASLRRRNDK